MSTVKPPSSSWSPVDMLLMIVAILACTTASQPCPAKCTCQDNVVDCSGRGLIDLPSSLPAGTRRLDLKGNLIAQLPPDAFGGLPALRELSLAKNRLTAIPTFTASNSLLEKLSLSGNNITVVSGEAIAALWRLNTLQLSGNKIMAIDDASFNNLTQLKQLRLSRNAISVWKTTSSNPLEKLETLDLSGNRLTTLKGLMFTGLLKLKVLNLKKNKIRDVQHGAFYFGHNAAHYEHTLEELYLQFNQVKKIDAGGVFGLERAKKINFSHNKIETIGEATFKDFSALNELDLSANRLTSIPRNTFADLRQLTYLSIANNVVENIVEDSFNGLIKLQTLDLSHNRISWGIHVTSAFFQGAQSLVTLDLAYNSIAFIHRQCFTGLSQLETLNLAENNISAIKEGAFSDLVVLKNMYLYSSHFRCDCYLKWFPVWIADKGLSDHVGGVCRTGLASGTNISDVEQEDFSCDNNPVIKQHPQSINAILDKPVVLSCSAQSASSDILEFTWTKGENAVVADDRIQITSESGSSHLLIARLENRDEGNYSCIVKNIHGADVSKPARLTANIKPVFVDMPVDAVVEHSGTFDLECSADGLPTPVIKYATPQTGRDRRPNIRDGKAVLENVTKKDEGTYTCFATNRVGTIAVNFTLIVLPERRSREFVMDVPPGKSVIMKCSDEHSGRKKWLKDGKLVVSSSQRRLTEQSGWLVFESVQSTDSGKYECKIRTDTEVIVETIQLTVEPSKITGDSDDMFYVWIGVSLVCGVLFATALWIIIFISLRWRGQERRRVRRMSRKEDPEKGSAALTQVKPVMPTVMERPNGSVTVSDPDGGSSGSGRLPIRVYVSSDNKANGVTQPKANGVKRESPAVSRELSLSGTSASRVTNTNGMNGTNGTRPNGSLTAVVNGKGKSDNAIPMVIVGPDGSFRAVPSKKSGPSVAPNDSGSELD
eukprot:m.308815 g.308815  ORF g.308815 m.308815 type:complete len:941 (+) comp44906_c0_seq1:146-2968(+)